MKKSLFFVLMALLVFDLSAVGKNALKKKFSNQSETVEALIFTNIAKQSNKCVLISGYSQNTNRNFFIHSCNDGYTIKETSSIGYVHDLYYTNDDSGWMLINHSIVKIENHKIIDIDEDLPENKSFDKILFVSSQKGWAIGFDGKIVFTEDGGRTWIKQNSNTDFDLERIVATTPENVWIIGSNYKSRGSELLLLKTEDSGKNWVKVKQSPADSFEKLFFLDSQNGWGLNYSGKISITNDGGITWKQTSKKLNFEDITFTSSSKGWAVNEKNLYRTTDGGLNWQIKLTLPSVSTYDFDKVIFADEKSGWLFSQEKILQTIDGGKTWQTIDIADELTRDFIK